MPSAVVLEGVYHQNIKDKAFPEGKDGGDKELPFADAARQIFSVQDSPDMPPWGGSGSSFSGSISHHEDAARLRAVYQAVKSTRESITGHSPDCS